MKQIRRWQRTLILALLSLSVVAPLIFVSHKLKFLTPDGRRDFLDDLSSFTYRTDPLKLNAIEQEGAEELEEPKQVVYKENDFDVAISNNPERINDAEDSSTDGSRSNLLETNEVDHNEKQVEEAQQKGLSLADEHKRNINETVIHNLNISTDSQRTNNENIEVRDKQSDHRATRRRQISRSQYRKVSNHKVEEIKDQIVRARAYLSFAPPGSNSHLVKELKLRIKEMERVVGEATHDSDLPRR
ncbi:hypothetical protein PIB30_011664 [Stylosanthes scabra]|uniref:Uncharacterized protein n=1 Tax=Stylosanthes scabra TaxID=79078 RepID=A0ABU6X7B0_9FABA|nr:hypothetical protein [Stylosanthes scabra]